MRDRALAEDIAQETLVKAWLALPTFRGESSLRGWVLRIAHNTAISTIRRRRAVVIDPHELPEEMTNPNLSVEARVLDGAAMDDFVEALDTLDDLSRSIVVLRELDGLSYEEIAEVLDVPMPTVKTRLLRAPPTSQQLAPGVEVMTAFDWLTSRRHPSRQALLAWLAGDNHDIDEHIATCHRCATTLEELEKPRPGTATTSLTALAAVYQSPTDLSERLERRVADRLDSRVIIDVVTELFGSGPGNRQTVAHRGGPQ